VSQPAPPARTLCLGEALVDLICERPIDDLAEADAFVPHFGGAVSNVAVVAARHGAGVALAGGAGEDSWGRWLRERLIREGVDVSLFELIEGTQTRLALVAIDARGEPAYEIYGEEVATVARAPAGVVERAIRESGALFISSNTLVGSKERAVTMRARELALELDRPLIFDPNLRLHRWPSHAEAAAVAVVVVTQGAQGALVRGELRGEVPGVPARVLSTVGAGDVMTGVLLASLAASGFEPSAVLSALPEAVEQAARACERWGALE